MLTAYLNNDICDCIFQAVYAPIVVTRLNIKTKIYLCSYHENSKSLLVTVIKLLTKMHCLSANHTSTYSAGKFTQRNSGREWISRISDFVLISDVDVSDSQLQVFDNIGEKFLHKTVLFFICRSTCKA